MMFVLGASAALSLCERPTEREGTPALVSVLTRNPVRQDGRRWT